MRAEILVLIVLLSFECQLMAQDLNEIMEGYFTKIGGKNRIEEVRSSHELSMNWYSSQEAPITNLTPKSGITETITQLPFFRKFNLFDSIGNLSHEYFYNEKEYVYVSPFGMHRGGHPSESQIEIDPAVLLFELHQEQKINYVDTLTIDSCSYYVLNASTERGNENFYINTRNYLLEMRQATNKPNRFKVYRGYSKTNLIMHPFLIEIYDDEKIIYKQTTTYFRFNLYFDINIYYYGEASLRGKSLKNVHSKVLAGDRPLNDWIKTAFKGKRILIDIWATWCAPCRKEFMHQNPQFHKALDSLGITVVYVSIDKDIDKAKWEDTLSELGLDGYHILAGKKLTKDLETEIFKSKNFIIPRYILIDENGKILSSEFIRPSNPEFKQSLSSIFRG